MIGNNKTVCFRNIIACCLMFSVFATSSMVAFAMPDKNSVTGELIVSGNDASGNTPFAMLNGERAFSGRTIFSSSTVATSENNNATVKLSKLGSIYLAPNSILSLSFGENKISGNLIAGQIKVFSSQGVEVKIQTANQVVANDASQNNVFTVDVQTGKTNAVAETGAVRLDNGDQTAPANTGQKSDDTSDGNSYLGPLLIFTGVVALAAVYVITHGDNNTTTGTVGASTTSPTR